MFQAASSPSPAAPPAGPLMTAEELFRFREGGWRHALVRGELQRMTLAGSRHGTVSTNVVVSLAHHVKTRRLGVVCGAGTGFVLARNPDTVLAPDVAFIRRERIPASGLPATFWRALRIWRSRSRTPATPAPRWRRRRRRGSRPVRAQSGSWTRAKGRLPCMSRAQPRGASPCRKFWMAHRCFLHSVCRSPTSSRRHRFRSFAGLVRRPRPRLPGRVRIQYRGSPHRRPSSSRASSHGASNALPWWSA